MKCLFSTVKFSTLRSVQYCLIILTLVGMSTVAQGQWTESNNGLNGGVIRSSASNADGSVLIVGVPNFGVYKSTDNGANWSVINNGLTSKQVYAVAISGTTLFAGMNGDDGVFKSTNGGLSWTQSGLSSQSVQCFTVKGTDIYAGTFTGVFKSTDNGVNWTAVNNGLTASSIASLTSNASFLFAGSNNEGLFRSADNGASWVPVNNGFQNTGYSIKSLVYNGTDLYAGTYNFGIYKSTDNGLNWAEVNTGLTFSPVLWVYSMVVSGTTIIAGSNNGIFITNDNGANWTASNTGLLNSFVNVLTVAGSNLFASTEGGAVYKSTNAGGSWAGSKAGIKNADINFFSSIGSDFFAGTNGAGLFKSTDTGQSWTEVNTGLTTATSRALLAASGKYFLATPIGVYVSTDEGLSWNITQLSEIDVSSLILRGTEIFAGTTTGVYKSTDDGVNWSPVSTGLTNLNVRALATSATHFFAGTEGGVFLSTNNGNNWSAVNTGLTSVNIHSLLIKDTDLYAGTQNNGIFKSSNNGTSWTNSNFPNGFIKSMIVANGNIFVPAANAVWSSSDNGANWTQPDFSFLTTNFNTAASVDDKLFVGTNLLGVFVRPLDDYFPPQVSSFSPTSGGSGTTVTITGTYLSTVSAVSFGDTPATSFTVVSSTTIEAVVADGASGSVSVTAPSGTASLAGFTFIPAPVVSSFSPLSAGAGASVTINGSNFTGTTSVSFGGTPATSFQILDAITISAVVGAGQTGDVSVTTPGGTATRTGFTFIGPPTIASFNPTSAPVGSSVTITGTNFSTTAANNIIKFNGTTATVTGTPTTTSIVTSVPVGATTGKITVEVGGLTATSATDFTVSAPTSPTLTGFSPSSGSVGTSVTIIGTNFSTTAANNIVKFNGATASIIGTPTATSIVASVPTDASTGKITVEVGGVTVTSALDYTVSATVTDVDGNIYNTIILGTQVWMGENLQTTKYSDGSSIPLITDNSLWLAATGPAYSWYNNDQATNGNTHGALYNWYVVDVASNGGKNVCPTGWHAPSDAEFTTLQSYLIANGFNYDGTTSGNKIGKSMAATTTWLANGTTGAVGNNDFPAYRNKTGFTGYAAGYRSVSAAGAFSGMQYATNWWTTNTPNFANGSYWRLILDNVDFSKFDVLRGEGNSIRCVKDLASSGPTIGSFTPGSGPIGTSVTITGTNFSSVAANNIVKFNGIAATITGTPTTTSIVTSVPTGASTGKITVEVGGETAMSTSDFTVTTIASPTISGFNPVSGTIGTSVTITGTNFSTTVANNIVRFNGTSATISGTPTTTSIITTVPTGATTGKITVQVGGETATSPSDFTVTSVSGPTISALNPSSGAVGTSVTITGTNFSTTAANNVVKFNGVTATITGTPTATSLVVTVPTGAVSGKVSVTVNGETATSSANFLVALIDNGLTIPYSSFGSAIQNYRIIAIPLTLTSSTPSSIFDELGVASKANWRLQRYSSGSTRDHTGTLNPGEGYWLIVRENPGVEIKTGPGSLVAAPFTSGFEITLLPGWNQIGNPYNFALNWSQVTAANPGLSTTLRKYDGTFTNGTSLAAMEGGFINNAGSSNQTIVIPLSGGAARQVEIVRNSLDQENWQLELVAEQGTAKNHISGLGMNKNASLEIDEYDGLNMPAFFDQFLELKHVKKTNNETFSSDIVPTALAHTWEFEIETTYQEEYITLQWDNTYFGENDRALMLWDVALQLPVNMREKSSYTFSKSVSKNFKVLFGDESKIQSELLASNLVFHSLSPNPATESVMLHFSLPAAGTVRLEAMDMMGRVVWNVEKYLEAGYHEQQWDRTTERAGVYLIQVKTKTTSQQKRVVFEK